MIHLRRNSLIIFKCMFEQLANIVMTYCVFCKIAVYINCISLRFTSKMSLTNTQIKIGQWHKTQCTYYTFTASTLSFITRWERDLRNIWIDDKSFWRSFFISLLIAILNITLKIVRVLCNCMIFMSYIIIFLYLTYNFFKNI